MDKRRCVKMVMDAGGFHLYQCSRKGKHLEDNKLWCGQHLPSAVAKKHKERDAEWAEERRVNDISYKVQAIDAEIVDCVVRAYGPACAPDDPFELDGLAKKRAALVAEYGKGDG